MTCFDSFSFDAKSDPALGSSVDKEGLQVRYGLRIHVVNMQKKDYDEHPHFILRKDDYGFTVGDVVLIKRYDQKHFTGKFRFMQIKHVEKNHEGLWDGYVALFLQAKLILMDMTGLL